MIGKSDRRSDRSVKCGICRAEIEDSAQIYQAGIKHGVVCSDYYNQFSANDLEMMANMFIAYGGYFGILKDSDFSLLKTMENVLKNALKEIKIVNIE